MVTKQGERVGADREVDVGQHALFGLDASAVACPSPIFARLREVAPVVWVPELESWVVTRHEDIASVLRQPALFSSAQATGPVLARQTRAALDRLLAGGDAGIESTLRRVARGRSQVLLSADDPDHGRQRSLVNRAFTPGRVGRSESDIRATAESLVDGFVADGTVELVARFAVPLPLSVIAGRLGVPLGDMASFKRWSDDFTVAIGNHRMTEVELRAMLVSQADFFAYFERLVARRREEPSDDLLSELAGATLPAGGTLSQPEILTMLNQFLVAGNETTTKLLGAAMLRLAMEPELADRIREEPGLVGPFVEEVLRLEAPVQGLYRTAVADVDVGGVAVTAGASLWLAYAAANRDPSVFERPDELDLRRCAPPPHLAFGAGEHFCLGAALARAEARIGVEVLLARMEDIRVADGAELRYVPSYVLHGLEELPLVFRAG